MVEYRRALNSDFEQIVELQNKNLFFNLNEKERQDGFLLTGFTSEQFKALNNSLCIAVAIDRKQIVGYVCASQLKDSGTFPFFTTVINRCSEIRYKGKLLSTYRYFIGSPICIDKEYRGKDLYVGLCTTALKLIPNEYDLCVGFISKENHRHLEAMKKMNFELAGQFKEGNHTFCIIVLPFKSHAGKFIL